MNDKLNFEEFFKKQQKQEGGQVFSDIENEMKEKGFYFLGKHSLTKEVFEDGLFKTVLDKTIEEIIKEQKDMLPSDKIFEFESVAVEKPIGNSSKSVWLFVREV